MLNKIIKVFPNRQRMLVTSFSLLTAILGATAVDASPVVLTFSTVGDSRQDSLAPDESLINPAQINSTGSTAPGANCYYPTTGTTSPLAASSGTTPNPGLTGQDCMWIQNSTAWSRIIRTIQSQKSNLLFFNGDMILGYGLAGLPVGRVTGPSTDIPIASPQVSDIVNSDLLQMYIEYGFWRGMVAPMIETGTYVVPVPGNHETECKRCGKKSQALNEQAWVANMGDLILDTTRLNNLLPNGLSLNAATWNPTTNVPSSTWTTPATLSDGVTPYGGTLNDGVTVYSGLVINGVGITKSGTVNPDKITTAQQQLSYSFDIGTNHFVVINTDPTGNDSHAPYNWLDYDLTNAVNNGAQNLFVYGHKPAFYYYYAGSNTAGTGLTTSSSSSLYLTDAVSANNFWGVITKHNATYFCGHEHIYNVSQPAPPTASTINTTSSYSNNNPNTYNETAATSTSNGAYTGPTNTSYQIIVGAGGSPFDDLLSSTTSPLSNPESIATSIAEVTGNVTAVESDRMYTWANVAIHQDNTVSITTYGFDPTVACNPTLNPSCGANFNGAMNSGLRTLSSFTLPYSAQ